MTAYSEKDTQWQAIAEQASKEQDSDRLMVLVAQLCSALESKSNRKLVAREVGPGAPIA